jgi:hypothetical protein
MQRFLLFSGYTYYAAGGWLDFKSSFTNLGDAKDEAAKVLDAGIEDWAHVVDTVTGIIVWESETRAQI